MIYNDAIGALVSFVANALGWAALAAIVATGFWVAGLYVARRVLELLEVAKRDFRRVLDRPKKPLQGVAPLIAKQQGRLVSVKP